MCRLKALAVTRRLCPGRNQCHGRLMAVFSLSGNIADGFVQQYRGLPGLRGAGFRRQGNHRIVHRARAQLRHALTVHEHQAAFDKGIRLAARTQAALGH